jgi:DNA invertase Pin-like site-specific DNA recombinase
VEEKISSRKPMNKRQLGALLRKLKTGDTLITSEISRLGCSLLEVMHILETCLNKNYCQVCTIKENYRLGNDIQSKVMAFAFSISAEIEGQLISERTKAALENVKASRKKLGRPFSAQSKKLKLSKNTKQIKDLLDKGVSKYKISCIMDVQSITVSRFIHRIG